MAARREKTRLDVLLVQRGLVGSREMAQRLIMAGEVLVDEQPATKSGMRVFADAAVTLRTHPRFVSRGGEKLSAALERFAIAPTGWVCADVGASTGGFTDCLLQAGALRVYAIDVGHGQLAWQLRQDSRVVVMEGVNVRYLDHLPEPIRFASIDVSFISLRLILPVVRGWLLPEGQVVALIKPQFEAGRADVGKGGVVRSAAIHQRVLHETLDHACHSRFTVRGVIPSPLRGPAGNIEFLAWFATSDRSVLCDCKEFIDSALAEAHAKPASAGLAEDDIT